MTEEDESPKETQEEHLGEDTKQQQVPERPAQIVEIKTPLDKPEFDFFIENFMKKTGLSDRKQAAIMLTNMFYDMGLNPYDDMKELTEAVSQMNMMIKNLPNSPAALQVKDTVAGMYAARAGRAMLEKFPKIGQRSESDDRMERIMDKYMPMILAMKTMGQMMIDPGVQQQQKAQVDVPPEFKKEIELLKGEFSEVKQLLITQAKEKEQKDFANNLLTTVSSQINPQIDAIRTQIETVANSVNALATAQAAAPQTPSSTTATAEIIQIKNDMKDIADRLGEKAGARGLTLDDVNPILDLVDKLDKRLGKKEPEGEYNWKAAAISTMGEIGKEAMATGKEIMQNRPQAFPGQQPQQPAAANEMKVIMKRQLQNYILQRLQKGATELNIMEAATTLGLSPQQVNEMYEQLVREGFIRTPKPPGTEAPPGAFPPAAQPTNQPTGGTSDIPKRREENQPFIET